MRDVMRVIGTARLAADPEMRSTASGMSICKLRIAWSTSHKDASGNWADRSSFSDLTVFGKSGESCGRFLSKGRQIVFEARLEMDEWTDKDSGKKRSKLNMVADHVQFVGGGGESNAGSNDGFTAQTGDSDLPATGGDEFTAQPVEATENIPF